MMEQAPETILFAHAFPGQEFGSRTKRVLALTRP